MEKYKVIVVGGGPSGAAAAQTLARNGVEVCVLEKGSYPRDKLCGGLLTGRSERVYAEIFPEDWRPVIHARSMGVTFLAQQAVLNRVEDYKAMFFTCRREFDHHLMGQAVRAGAKLVEKAAVTEVDVERGEVRLQDGRVLGGEYLIGADGVNSAVARGLFGAAFSRKTIGFGFEVELPIGPHGPYEGIRDPEIHFGVLPWGYGWVFPKRSSLTAGIGGLLRKSPGMRKVFEEFLKDRFGQVPQERVKGHHIPFGDFRRVPGRGNVLLCGDAAGLVEPITGEGIAFAMLSGREAAAAVIESVRRGRKDSGSALDVYGEGYGKITREFRSANRLRYLIFPKVAQALFTRVLPHTASIPRRHLDLMANDIDYGEYADFLRRKLGRVMGERVRQVLGSRPGTPGNRH